MRDHRCGVTGWITGPDFCQGSRALVRSLQADGKYCHVFDSQHYFHREQSRVMKSLCWSETGDDGGRFRPLKERKRGRVNGSARFWFCAQVLHLTQIKEPFQLLKKHVLPLIKPGRLWPLSIWCEGAGLLSLRSSWDTNLRFSWDIKLLNSTNFMRPQQVPPSAPAVLATVQKASKKPSS